jgi:hypothetical protein
MALDPERRNLDLRVLSAVPVARNAIEQLVAQIKGTVGLPNYIAHAALA